MKCCIFYSLNQMKPPDNENLSSSFSISVLQALISYSPVYLLETGFMLFSPHVRKSPTY